MKTNRRNFFHTITAGVAGLGITAASPIPSFIKNKPSNEAGDEQLLFIGDDIAIAKTVYGKVQGFKLRDILQFRGIPYGADTSGKNRFMPPQKPEPWTDTKPALWWGNTAPQQMENRYANAHYSFADHWNYDDVSEDCLKLNVWTPSIADSKKRPVLVWLHGGGYRNGNGIEQDGYDGENLSRKGDIVFVSINHRLGPIGFTDLSAVGGEKFKHSGNVGALDMVAALVWVKENIENFGGDPANVTIMGQSGGGAKVCILGAMPQTKGLFHKMVPLSGSTTQAIDQSYSQKLGEYVLREAGLSPAEMNKLQEMPWQRYLDVSYKAEAKLREETGGESMFRGGFGPVADGINLPREVFFSDNGGTATDVPMLICSTFHEWGMSRTSPEMENISEEKAIDFLKERAGFMGGLGEKAPEVYQAYANIFPDAKPIEIMTLVSSNRNGVVNTANAKLQQNAPVYVAWFGWEPNLYNGRMRAFHCLDICFWFNNTDLMLTHTGGGARPRKLADKMSSSLIQFMKTGNPNGGGLPEWDKYTAKEGEVMVLNDECELMNDPDREARATWQ
ncbi:carboxylesterase/lipase family protein [Chondrinema litorale]|uniref:carboxylesterase/lipase family protein n=1 Tax=Chondrinema litorale TaxID=2994555 RepID=UPI0025427A61|nr:carboxylesterase family protein [Chondrinema litorale]UZR96514.1 carboxylesterase family protein [Chondrinema litorale]